MDTKVYEARGIGYLIFSSEINPEKNNRFRASILGVGNIKSVSRKVLKLRVDSSLKAVRVGPISGVSGENWTSNGLGEFLDINPDAEEVIFNSARKPNVYYLRGARSYERFASLCQDYNVLTKLLS